VSCRCARSFGAAALALCLFAAVSVVFGAVAAPRAGATTVAPDGPVLSLVDQSPWVKPSQPDSPTTFTLDVATRTGTPTTDEVATTLYGKLHTRSSFEQTLARIPSGSTPIDHTRPESLSSLPAFPGGGVSLSISVLPDPTATPAPSGSEPTLDLGCVPDTGTCTGVYPLVVSLVRPGSGGTVAKFTTYLTYATAKSATPLEFSWVVPVTAPLTIHFHKDPARAVTAPSRATIASLAGLVATLFAKPGVPVTVAASPQTLQALSGLGGKGAQAVQELATMSSADHQAREFLAQPYVPIDLGSLAGAGEGEEIAAQSKKGLAVLRSLNVKVGAKFGTWVATGTVGGSLRSGMSQIGASRLVLPGADLVQPRSASDTWASPFTLSLGRGAPLTAAASDAGLAAHFTSDPADPGLEANQLLADLAMIHSEAPNTRTPRAVIAVPPSNWTPSKAFDTELLAGLETNPDVQPTTLDGLFSAFSRVPRSTVPSRRLLPGATGLVLTPSLARHITIDRLRLTAFDNSVLGDPPVLSQLDDLLLAAESDDLQHTGEVAGVDTFTRVFDAQLSLVQLPAEREITLTARTGLIPVTIDSQAGYTVTGRLTLTGERFSFPHGNTRQLTLDHATNPVRVEVEARSSGNLPLEASFKSPTGSLLIARSQLDVRATATSAVAVALTVLALLVLGGWWARTWWARHRRRIPQPGGTSGT